MVSTNN